MGIGMLKSPYCKKQHQDKIMFFLVHRIMKCSLTSSSHLSLKFKFRWNTNRFWIIFSKWYPNYPSDNNIAVKLRSPKNCKAQHAITNLFLITSIKKIVNDFSSSLHCCYTTLWECITLPGDISETYIHMSQWQFYI